MKNDSGILTNDLYYLSYLYKFLKHYQIMTWLKQLQLILVVFQANQIQILLYEYC
jgi:hypothetical protein